MKQTSFSEMQCSVARSLESVGPWWSLLIVRDSMMGLRRFNEFQRSLGIAKNTLTNRLSELIENGIMQKVPSERGLKYAEYELTEKGIDLAPVVMALAQWGDKWAAHEKGPSYAFLDKNTGLEFSRIWPRRDNGEKVSLEDVVLKRHSTGTFHQLSKTN